MTLGAAQATPSPAARENRKVKRKSNSAPSAALSMLELSYNMIARQMKPLRTGAYDTHKRRQQNAVP